MSDDLMNYSIEELENALRKKNDQNELSNLLSFQEAYCSLTAEQKIMKLDRLFNSVFDDLKRTVKDGGQHDELPHYTYEEVYTLLFGDQIWPFINSIEEV